MNERSAWIWLQPDIGAGVEQSPLPHVRLPLPPLGGGVVDISPCAAKTIAACHPASEDDRVILKCCGAVVCSNLSKVWTPLGGLALSHHLGPFLNIMVFVPSPHHPQCVLHHSVGCCRNSLGKWEVIREGLSWGDDLNAKAFLTSDLMLFCLD